MKSQGTCYYCGSNILKNVLPIDRTYRLERCSKCELVFTYPQEKIEIVEENDKKYNSKDDEKSYLGIYDQVYKRARKYIQMIQKYKASGKYLDIGCSYGVYLKAAKEARFDTYGVEMAPNAANYARKKLHLNVFTGTLEKAKYNSETFDVVTLYDVLEHIPNITQFLNEVYRVLKPEGLLVIQCPNVESYAFRVLGKKWNWLLVPQHLWHFSPKILERVLKDHKFFVIKKVTWDSPYDFASNWVTKIGLTSPHASFPRRLVRKGMYFLLYGGISVGSFIWRNYGKGGSQIVYATKK